jgi:hypothetical protein
MAELHTTQSTSPQAPLESTVARELGYTFDCQVFYKNLHKGNNTLWTYVQEDCAGCGNVDLISVQAICVCSNEGDWYQIGLVATGSGMPLAISSMRENGAYHVANARNYGIRNVHELIPDSNLSRQLFPTSSQLPSITMAFEKSKGTTINFHIKLKVNGVIVKYCVDRNV